MIEKFAHLSFLLEIGIAFIWAVALYFLVQYYWKSDIEIKSDYLKVPTNNTLLVLGLIVPTLIALVSYLYTKNPEGTYSSLLATIVLFFLVLVIAIWETFAILSIASKEDTVKIEVTKDLKIITGMAWMYGFLVLGLVYFAIFFLFEIESPSKKARIEKQISDFVLLEKPHLKINQCKDQIIKIWGEPVNCLDIDKRKLKYKSKDSVIYLDFDENGKLWRIRRLKQGKVANMNGERFLEEIEKKIGPDENYADIVTMINILANERAKANNRDIKDEDYDYAAGIICIVFPMKPPEYKEDIEALRKNFKGISTDLNLQKEFIESMTDDLLKEQSIEDAVELSVDRLFKL
jgi:hypothetical protein